MNAVYAKMANHELVYRVARFLWPRWYFSFFFVSVKMMKYDVYIRVPSYKVNKNH